VRLRGKFEGPRLRRPPSAFVTSTFLHMEAGRDLLPQRQPTGFSPDSPLEGDGFEPSVPGTKEPVFVAEGELRDRTGAAKKGCF
jgi:hypothetical protein